MLSPYVDGPLYRSDAPAAAEHAARETGLGDAMGRCGGKESF